MRPNSRKRLLELTKLLAFVGFVSLVVTTGIVVVISEVHIFQGNARAAMDDLEGEAARFLTPDR